LTAAIFAGIEEDCKLHGSTVKFFTKRGDYPSYYHDLERYKMDEMAVLDAAEAGTKD
jgi:hypothetical protein